MSRTPARLLAGSVAVILAVTGLSGAAAADSAPAAVTGTAVATVSTTFVSSAAQNGVVVLPLPDAGVSYNSAEGLKVSFPVTGGSVSLQGYYGEVQLGGSLLFIDYFTGKSVRFKQLAFNAEAWRLTGVPEGGTTAVNLLKPAGVAQTGHSGTTQTLNSSDFKVDASAAQYLDTQLKTTFFTAGQSVGSFSLTVNG
ncbi:hypothetical protein ACIQOW_27205 [Kitasatospora sp. NPDC091335]|uniref:hypothetical protein n=1 Tax=Streptomycetaceae TaxID=2062 RepID=UPI0016620559|nr:hypothetical protein [Streptomyces sp. CBMA156]MBD0670782.1 hypothetical protein [Streptomyces sp. CBMA156]